MLFVKTVKTFFSDYEIDYGFHLNLENYHHPTVSQTSFRGRNFSSQFGFDKIWNPNEYDKADIYDFCRFTHYFFSERQIANLVNEVRLTLNFGALSSGLHPFLENSFI